MEKSIDITDVVGKAFQQSIDIASKAFGVQPKDQDVEFYDSLTPEDFTAIRNRLGMADTTRWIKQMEAKRSGLP